MSYYATKKRQNRLKNKRSFNDSIGICQEVNVVFEVEKKQGKNDFFKGDV